LNSMPTKHLSARVPWHDQKWNGTVCKNVLDNSFCRILPHVDSAKDPELEQLFSSQPIIDLGTKNYPPCIAEKGTFMSKHEYVRELEHAYKSRGNTLFRDFLPATYHHKPYSFNAIPFQWMSKDKESHESEMAKVYELDYDPHKEESVDVGFKTSWVQHPDNQRALLDGFFSCLKPHQSLVFFYSKHTPLSEPNEQVIVGVARVRFVGELIDFRYPNGYKGHRSYVWDRCVGHTLTDEFQGGFLMPYHDILEHVDNTGEEIELRQYVAFATDHRQFSYASELVEHDTAIEALLQIAAALKQSSKILARDFSRELQWVDDRIAEIWDMRGAFPGMGPVLAALKFENANAFTWEVEKHIFNKYGDLLHSNPWDVFEAEVSKPGSILGNKAKELMTATNQRVWQLIPGRKKDFYKLLSRCQLNNDQAIRVIRDGDHVGSIDEMTENLYLIYERTRLMENGFTFDQIDKALLPMEKVQLAFPIPEPSQLMDNLDERRVRALKISILEHAAVEGHSLLPENELLDRIERKQLQPNCPLNSDILEVYRETNFINEEVRSISSSKENPQVFYKLKRLCEVKDKILMRTAPDHIVNRTYNIEHNWLGIIDNEFNVSNVEDNSKVAKARMEKAEALRVMCNYRFSVLIGPAGSGKTTLLKIFEHIPEIVRGGVLKLAPTGKARVKLGSDAKTLAQFLIPNRYDAATGVYFINSDAPKYAGAQTVIVDEASMLTEEQLAALFDALGSVERIILVGDYRQLPPIGTGRPFVDIVKQFKPEKFDNPDLRVAPAYAELIQIHRQSLDSDSTDSDVRVDVQLSQCFSDQLEKENIDIANRVIADISSGKAQNPHIRLIKWYDSFDLREQLKRVLVEELGLRAGREDRDFQLSIGATESGEYVYFNRGHAEKFLENWQIISPVNGYGYGVKEVNKFIQSTYRKSFLDLAYNVKADGTPIRGRRKIAKPKGSDNVVYGDKVINLRNTKWRNWQWIKPAELKGTALNYIANGEIGIITGEFRSSKSTATHEPNIEISFATQPGYSYVFSPNQLGEDGLYPIDLAYCISVHKSQGSGFSKVFFILPSGSSLVSRELLYTALTRQVDQMSLINWF